MTTRPHPAQQRSFSVKARAFFHVCFFAVAFLALFNVSFTYAANVPAGVELADVQVLRKGNAAEPGGLDPHTAEGVPSSNIQRDLFEGLIGEAPNGDLEPGVAERWEISDDGTIYTFYLRANAKWSNGDPVTAHDFEYGIKRTVTPATGSEYAQTLASIKNAEAIIRGDLPPDELGVTALSDTVLRVELVGPTPYFLGLLTHSTTYALPQKVVEQYGDKFTRPGNMVSNGAYQLAEWEVNSHITLVRNPHYWDNENTIIDEVVYYAIEDMDSEALRYRAGELSMTYNQLTTSAITWFKQNAPDELYITPYLGIYYYGLNVTRPPFKDSPKLRQALSMVIDRSIITDKVLRDGSRPAFSFVPEGTLNSKLYQYEWKDWPMDKRIAYAKELYREAGYSEDNPLRTEFRYNTQENHKRVGLAVAAMWKERLGVITTLVNQEWKVFLEVRKARRITEVVRNGWIGDYNDPYSFMELAHSQHGQNDSGYSNPKYDALLVRSSVEADLDERADILLEAEKIMLEDYPVIPIYYYSSTRAVKPYVGGYVGNIMDHIYTKDLYIKAH